MKTTLGIVLIITFVFVGVYFFIPGVLPWKVSGESRFLEGYLVYQSEAYEFSFVYPNAYEALEYSEENISVGNSTDQGFVAVAEISLVEAAPGVTYVSFEDFVYERARLACATGDSQESVSCTTVQGMQSFETEAGFSGRVFHLTEMHTDLVDNTVTMSVEGPFFAFDISSQIPSSQFAALLIHPPVTITTEEVNSSVLHLIAHSVEAK